jgi:drug/metabolite transporter (DMT)-like permease
MLASMMGFSTNDAMMKSLAGELSLEQAVFLRGMLASVLIGGLAWSQGVLPYRPVGRDVRLVVLRSVGEIAGTVCFLTALFHMPIANASAILQSLPLAVTLAAALVFGEPVGWRRYLAIGVGFAGVLIIVRPGSEGFNAYALWALLAVGFIVLRDLSSRRMSPGAPALAVVLYTTLALTTAAGLATLAGAWQPVEWWHLAVLLVAAVCLLVAYIFAFLAMRIGDIGFVQPFRYALLLWAIVLGIVMFGEWPDLWMLVGSAIVVATGLFTFYRERRLAAAHRG